MSNFSLNNNLPFDSQELQNLAHEINNAATDIASGNISDELFEKFVILKRDINMWIQQADAFLSMLSVRIYGKEDMLQSQQPAWKDVNAVLPEYRLMEDIEIASMRTEFGGLLTTGYQILDSLRYAFTGSQIVLHVATIDEKGDIYAANIPMEEYFEAMPIVDFHYDPSRAKTFMSSLRFTSIKNNEQQDNLLKLIQRYSDKPINMNLYNIFINKSAVKKKNLDQGRLYEAFRDWENHKYKDLDRILSQIENNTPMRFGGDSGLEQIKTMLDNAFPFTSMNQLYNTFQRWLDIFNEQSPTKIKKRVKQLFMQSVDAEKDTRLTQRIKKKEENYFEKIIEPFKNFVLTQK